MSQRRWCGPGSRVLVLTSTGETMAGFLTRRKGSSPFAASPHGRGIQGRWVAPGGLPRQHHDNQDRGEIGEKKPELGGFSHSVRDSDANW